MIIRTSAILFSMTIGVFAQSPLVLRFNGEPGSRTMQEMSTVVRSAGDVRDAQLDADTKTLTINGAPWQNDMASWLFAKLDTGVGPERYEIAGQPDAAVRVLSLESLGPGQAQLEFLRVVRSIVDIRRAFLAEARRAIVVRGTADEVASVEWLTARLLGKSAESGWTLPGNSEGSMRVVALRPTLTDVELQEAAARVRVASRIRRMFVFMPSRMVALRGTPEQAGEAERLFRDQGLLAE